MAARSALTKSSSTTSSTMVPYASERHSSASNHVKRHPSCLPIFAGGDGRASRVREGSETRRLTQRRNFRGSVSSRLCWVQVYAMLCERRFCHGPALMVRDTAPVHQCRETVDPQDVGSLVEDLFAHEQKTSVCSESPVE